MKKNTAKIIGIICLVLSLLLFFIFELNYIVSRTYSVGEITSKYKNGDNKQTFHIVVRDETKNDDLVDVVVDEGQYNKFEISQRVFVDYNLLRQAQSNRVVVSTSWDDNN